MSRVGEFPGFAGNRRRTVRAPTNPMDKSTVVSIFPKEIKERHYTIQPGVFNLAPGSIEHPSLLVVGSSSWWREVDEHAPLLEIPCNSNQVADAIVKGFASGMLGCNMTNSMPGVFWLPGEVGQEELKTKYALPLNIAKSKQTNFYKALVKFADTFWARTNGNPLCISDEMRLAARELNLVDKEWMKDHLSMGKVKCPACGARIEPDYPVCGTCRAVVNPQLAKERGIVFASQPVNQ